MGLTIRDALLIRIVDLRAALEGRGYAAPGSLTFDLTDVDRPVNDGACGSRSPTTAARR
jgi:hypothetical protein